MEAPAGVITTRFDIGAGRLGMLQVVDQLSLATEAANIIHISPGKFKVRPECVFLNATLPSWLPVRVWQPVQLFFFFFFFFFFSLIFGWCARYRYNAHPGFEPHALASIVLLSLTR